MADVNYILSLLPPYRGVKNMVRKNQSVEDIISGILETHKKYTKEYDAVYKYFLGNDLEQTCKNIFDFLKQYTVYKIESENIQLLKSPAAILSQVNNDCKNYALFTAGILDAIRRNTDAKFNFVFRFAGYRSNDQEPEHVFIVVNHGKKKEIWIDAVLDYFDYHKQPKFYIDYKPLNMLYTISGVDAADVTKAAGGALKSVPILNTVLAVLPLFAKLFSGSGPNPQDWRGWTPGDVKQWVANDGDSIQNEAVNINSYITAHGLTDIIDSDAFGRKRVTIVQIADKYNRAGFPSQAAALLSAYNGAGTGSTNVNLLPGQTSPVMAGQNKIFTYAIVGAGLFLAYQMFKKK